MNVLIVGTGGREHAIAKALHRSKHNVNIYAIGGWVNPGIKLIGTVDVMDINNPELVVAYAQNKEINIVIIGSENQLEQGLADYLQSAGIFCVGPTKDLALLETDKIYARSLIDTQYNPLYRFFYKDNYSTDTLQEWVDHLHNNYVIKAVGLRAGKGVKVSNVHLHSFKEADQYCRELIEQDGVVLVEERLFGEEFTLLAFADGKSLINMPVVKDFKCLYNNDCGPNTGGMGCISFPGGGAPFLSGSDLATANDINKSMLKKLPGYVGVLYGSFMKTDNGVKVIEYNCRFGDPEAINVLELLETDFLDILLAIQTSTLDQINIRWSPDAVITTYVVAPGYPDSPQRVNVHIPNAKHENIIYAKIVERNGQYTQLASRSFATVSRGRALDAAFEDSQRLLALLDTNTCFFRTDLGEQWVSPNGNAYTKSGVNVAEGDLVVHNIKECVKSTWNSNVVSNFGDFAGMYNLNGNILVTSTDGVGTKTIAVLQAMELLSGFNSLGHDIVNHCVNDILVKGAEPMFFLDYIASSKLCADHVTSFITGAAEACKESGCVLIGGETAEMPDVYNAGHVDIVGTIVGVVSPEMVINGPECIEVGDIVIGLRSSGPHTNGYSLIRKVLSDILVEDVAPHKCYLHDIRKIRAAGIGIKGLCHITGGGWWGNIKRVLPAGLSVDLLIPRPAPESVFTRVQKAAKIPDNDMLDIFNMGFGMLIIIDVDDMLPCLDLFSSDYAEMLGGVCNNPTPNISII